MLLIKNGQIYSHQYLGEKDILIINGKIAKIGENIEAENLFPEIKVIDAKGKKIVPGFIDPHVHITGGGGEASFKTRVPEIMLSNLTRAGITTVVGLLGTDGSSRSMENVVAKAKALEEEGITAHVISGSYEVPTVTLTENLRKDILFVKEIIGGKIAISDHRDSAPSRNDLVKIASDVRVANMLSGKNGGLVLHVGNGKNGLQPILDIIQDTEIPARTFRPTHVNRSEKLIEEAFQLTKLGGIIDLTCGIYDELSPANVVIKAKKYGANLENITISSDGYGSWSKYDEFGKLVKIGVSSVESLYKEFQNMVLEKEFEISEALRYFTSNTAKALGIYPQKGSVSEMADGDLLIIDDSLEIDTVIAKGEIMVQDGEIIRKGTYES